MNIKPRAGRRNYGKGYAMGGTIWDDPTSTDPDHLPISGGSANLPGGTVQTGGTGVYDPKHPERGAQGASEFYEPAEGQSRGTMGGTSGTTTFVIKPREGGTRPRGY